MSRFADNLFRLITGHLPPRSPRRKVSALYRGPARDELYLAWIRTLRCCACGHEAPSEAAHVGRDGGKGIKCSDYHTIPLCYQCHRTGIYSFEALKQGAYHQGKRTFAAMFCLDYDALVSKYNGVWESVQGVAVFQKNVQALNSNVQPVAEVGQPDCTVGSGAGVESETLVVASGVSVGAQTAQGWEMTIREKMIELLVERGMFPSMAEAALERCEKCGADHPLASMRDRWKHEVLGYPQALMVTCFMAVSREALAWIDANLPDAWFRPLFDDQQMEEIKRGQIRAGGK